MIFCHDFSVISAKKLQKKLDFLLFCVYNSLREVVSTCLMRHFLFWENGLQRAIFLHNVNEKL